MSHHPPYLTHPMYLILPIPLPFLAENPILVLFTNFSLMNTFKLLSLSLLTVLLVSACSPQKASDEVLKIIDAGENESTTDIMETEEPEAMEAMEKEDPQEDAISNDEEAMIKDENKGEGELEPFSYETYSAARFAELKGSRPVVLSFHADWCPTCRALDSKVNKSLDQLPEGAVMLKVDYDKEVELKKEFGITNQTTLVFFNAAGEQIAKEYNPSIEKIATLLNQ